MKLPPIHSATGRDLSDDDADKQDEELERSDRTEDWRGIADFNLLEPQTETTF